MQAQSTRANGAPVSTVTLTREHRDAIWREAQRVLLAGRDLALAAEGARARHAAGKVTHECDRLWLTHHREWVLQYSRELQAATRLLDRLGWLEQHSRESHELEIDEDLEWFILRMDPRTSVRKPSTADEWWADQAAELEMVA